MYCKTNSMQLDHRCFEYAYVRTAHIGESKPALSLVNNCTYLFSLIIQLGYTESSRNYIATMYIHM